MDDVKFLVVVTVLPAPEYADVEMAAHNNWVRVASTLEEAEGIVRGRLEADPDLHSALIYQLVSTARAEEVVTTKLVFNPVPAVAR